MIKTRWVRNAAVFGTAVTLSLACAGFAKDSTAAGFCQETDMAGLSLSLDKYYTENYAAPKEESDAKSEDTATATPAPTASADEKEDTPKKTEEKRKEETVAKQFRDLGIADVSDYVNIRSKPTTESKIRGKLYRGSAAKIIGEKDGWVKIESGSVRGFIRKDLLAIGAKAQKLAGKFGTAYATVKPGTITLNVRSKKSTESSIVTQIPEDEKYEVIGESDNWYRVTIDEDTKGYVAKEFIKTRVRFKKAISIAEEKAELRRKAAAEKAERERLEALA
ncbi:MAG TPA: hypothetical protein DDY31_01415, partial [Lachnospiraceae bacterium]|nr:hypothetical protein [Lachnospiraceae bacterium]